MTRISLGEAVKLKQVRPANSFSVRTRGSTFLSLAQPWMTVAEDRREAGSERTSDGGFTSETLTADSA